MHTYTHLHTHTRGFFSGLRLLLYTCRHKQAHTQTRQSLLTVNVRACSSKIEPGYYAAIVGVAKCGTGDELFLDGDPYVGGQRHPLRRTLLVRLSAEDARTSCFPVGDIDAQVLLHHHCCVEQSNSDRISRDKVLLKVPSGVEDKEDQEQRRKRNNEAKAHNEILATRRFEKRAMLIMRYCTCGASVC